MLDLLLFLGAFGGGLAVGIALERRLFRLLGAVAGDTTRGGALVGAGVQLAVGVWFLVGAGVGGALADGGRTTTALVVLLTVAAAGTVAASPLLPWVNHSGWRFVASIARDARAAGVAAEPALGLARAGAWLGYPVVWPGVFVTMVPLLEVV